MDSSFPYFQFEPAKWLGGKIASFGLDEQGLFLHLCITSWISQGEFNICSSLVQRKFNKSKEWIDSTIEAFCECGIIERDADLFTIKFIEDQLTAVQEKRVKLSRAGKESAAKRIQNREKKSRVEKSRVECSTNVQQMLNSSSFESIAESTNAGRLDKEELSRFCGYWLEKSHSGKCRFEAQKFFEMTKRIATWSSRCKKTFSSVKPERRADNHLDPDKDRSDFFAGVPEEYRKRHESMMQGGDNAAK